MDGTNSSVEGSGETKPRNSLGSIDAISFISFMVCVGVSIRFGSLVFARDATLSLGTTRGSVDGSGVSCTERLSSGAWLESMEKMTPMLTNGVPIGS